jgi:ribosomal protein L6P/L9E
MAPKINLCYAYLDLDDKRISSTELRGYLGYLFVNDPEFHHHSPSSYHYPLVQYKMANSKLVVMGIGRYSDVVFERMSQIENIVVPNCKVRVNNIELETVSHEVSHEQTSYEFTSPWLALNSTNYENFLSSDKNQRKELLQRILVANILSMLKGLDILYKEKIVANIEKYKTKITIAHENKFAGIWCKWNANISLPNYIGIGKSVSKGFGVIRTL